MASEITNTNNAHTFFGRLVRHMENMTSAQLSHYRPRIIAKIREINTPDLFAFLLAQLLEERGGEYDYSTDTLYLTGDYKDILEIFLDSGIDPNVIRFALRNVQNNDQVFRMIDSWVVQRNIRLEQERIIGNNLGSDVTSIVRKYMGYRRSSSTRRTSRSSTRRTSRSSTRRTSRRRKSPRKSRSKSR